MNIKPLNLHHFEFLSLMGGCTGSFEYTLVQIPLCWKSHVAAQIVLQQINKTGNHSEAKVDCLV